MSDPYGVKQYLDKFGSEDAKILAMIIYHNTEIFSMSAHDGMDALKRLADRELEGKVLDALVRQGHEVSHSLGSDGRIWTKITFQGGSFVCMPSVTEVISGVAVCCGSEWPQELHDLVTLYLVSQAALVQKLEKKGGPPSPLEKLKRR